jgi:hypothetical protein
MSDTISLNTSLPEAAISSQKEGVFIRDLSDFTLQIILNDWLASMNIGLKRLIALDNSRHAPAWQFYIHCGTEGTASSGIICIVRHQVLYNLLEHGTSSLGRHLLAKVHITKLNELTVSEVTELSSSMVNETALAKLK